MFDAVALTHATHAELNLKGEFDFTREERAREAWLDLIRSAPQFVLLDVSGLTFADSTAVRFLLWCTRQAAGRDYALALVTGANERLHRLLQMLGWEQFMPLYPTRASAIAALTGPADPEHSGAGWGPRSNAEFCDRCPIPKEAQRLASLLEYTSDAVFSLDLNGQLTDVNAAAETLSGYSREELIGRHFEGMLPPGEQERPFESFRRALEGEPQQMEAVILHRSGRRVELDVTAVPIKVDGAITGVFGVARDVTRRKEAERRIAMLVETGRRLTGARDVVAAVAELGLAALPTLGDVAVTDLVQPDGTLRRLSAAQADNGGGLPVPDLLEQPLPAALVRLVVDEGKSLLVAEPAAGEESADLPPPWGGMALLSVPLAARGRVLGVLTFARTSPGRYTGEDLGVAEELGRDAGLSLDNARLYQTQAEIAHTLQHSLLPSSLPEIAGVDVACCYQAAGELYEVGGDFYDLFPASRESWVALIGDVTGKGATAAAVTAVVRHTIRAAAHLTRWPRWMLERANTALLEQPDWDGLCTALCVRLTRGPRGLIARGASAGHLPPLTLRADGAVQSIERPGLMLGVLPSLDLQEWAVELRQGDSLILYTDGVTEARREGRLFGEDRLRALVQSCAGLPPTELVTRVERAVLEFQQYEPADDFAVLVLRIAEGYSTAPHR